MKRRINWTLVAIIIVAVGLTAGATNIPSWIRYSCQMAISAALAASGVMLLLRAGLLSLGQGLFYFVGGYTAALLPRYTGITDAVAITLCGSLCAGMVAAVASLFIAKYRGIFFAMLTLAISMVVYGIAIKAHLFGGSDGFNITPLTFFGYRPRGADVALTSFVLCVWAGAVFAAATTLLLRSRLGKLTEAIEDNEVRVEYLGWSVKSTIQMIYVMAGILGGAGGATAAIAARHVDPNFAYWTTGGEFVFVALLGGQTSAISPFAGAAFLEILRIFAAATFPDDWQLVQGIVMLVVAIFVPGGLGTLATMSWAAWINRIRSPPTPAVVSSDQVK